ncbi:cytochrome P450 [Epithele typhae]|uniref:cytochrome P450 n=1 Tax=Epithele typhae TaxID=378194 RepID=UPI002007EDBD|nr:cytochrome P450 [Epithele typhae]KAH9936872.1 cytochrome P450 [Epithele typhae]
MTLSQDLLPALPPLWQLALLGGAAYAATTWYGAARRRARATPLAGPLRPSWLFGVTKQVLNNPDAPAIYEGWVEEYGAVFVAPAPLGATRVVLTDPKAVAHFYAAETWTYVQTKLARVAIEGLFGRGLLWAEGESHKRQRKAISPAFSNVAIKRMTAIFYDSVYKLKTAWDNQLAGADAAVIDVEAWMNHVSLDSIGIAGFSHDFRSLDGQRSDIAEVFDAMGRVKPSVLSALVIFFGNVFPVLWKLPTEMRRLQRKMNRSMEQIAVVLLENTRRELRGLGETGKEEKSIIGLLIKAEDQEASLPMSQEEIMAQALLILAGYETTSISLTWALIELCRKPEMQARLRDELRAQFPNSDPSWDQLMNGAGLHYLDAVVHEILRLHAPLAVTNRVAAKDDVIPLSQPIRTKHGELVDAIAICAGQEVGIPIGYMNTALALWGPDAREFKPERWLLPGDGAKGGEKEQEHAGLPRRAQEIQGHRHLLTFVDGQRMCLGRGFALAEFKAVLGVLIKNYTFELRDGPETEIAHCRGVLPRPQVKGEVGACVPMRVRRVDA